MTKILTESSFDTKILVEEKENGQKDWYIEGIFMQADVVNRNRRNYPREIMEKEIGSYINEYVTPRRAVGELSHPDTAQINLDKITHIVEEIRQEGNNFYGKARILNTPAGNIVKGLLEGGVQLGVSSRGMGSVKRNSQGINEVQNDFKLAAIDIVYQPSAPDAFVQGLMESSEGMWDTISEDVEFVESLKSTFAEEKEIELQESKIEAFSKFLEAIESK